MVIFTFPTANRLINVRETEINDSPKARDYDIRSGSKFLKLVKRQATESLELTLSIKQVVQETICNLIMWLIVTGATLDASITYCNIINNK